MRQAIPGAKLCVPVLPEWHQLKMNHAVEFPPEDVVDLPPLESVIRSQRYFFQTRRIVREFADSVDVLFIRAPFPIPAALAGLRKPKVMHVVSNPYNIIGASTDYHGVMRMLALGYAAHTQASMRRMAARPDTRTVTNGREMWDLLGCRRGRVVVSSCIYQREMRPREDRRLGTPPKLLFVGYLRPEKGLIHLLDAFESLRAKRELKLTLVGGSDRATNAEDQIRQRIDSSPYRQDITLTGMLDFGEPLFELYRSHDLYVLPSLSEGTPRTLVEARAFGCPVVATRVGGIPTSVDDGRTGLLVEPGDSQGLAAAIDKVLSDEPLRHSLIQQGLAGSGELSLEYFAGQLIEELKIAAGQGQTKTLQVVGV